MIINKPFFSSGYRSKYMYKMPGVMALLVFLSLKAFAQSEPTQPTPAPTPEASSNVAVRPAQANDNAPIKIGSLNVSGSLRVRFESWDWFDAPPAEDRYDFGAIVLRLGIGQNREKFEWFLEGEAPLLIGLPKNAIAPGAQGQLGLGATYYAVNGGRDGSAVFKQGFVRLKELFGSTSDSLKIGRFDFGEGLETKPDDATLASLKQNRIAQRLIGVFGFTHIQRGFDGVQYAHQSKASNFTFLAARPTSGAFDLDANKELDVDIYYGAFTKPLKSKSSASEFRVFELYYHDGRQVLKTDNRTAAARAADLGKIRITTVGGNYIGVYKTGGGKTDLLLWGAGQFGSWGNLDHRAAAIAVEAGYQPGGKISERIKPWFRGGYFRSSGDGNPNDHVHGTFFQVLPTTRQYARFPFFNLMNNEDSFGEVMLKPHAKLAARADLHYLRLSSANDLWYSGGGAFQNQTFGFTGRPANGGKSLGTLADISLDYTVTPSTLLTFYLGGVRGGSVMSNIYPLGGNSRFAYIELAQKF
jgi:hypothetical protein